MEKKTGWYIGDYAFYMDEIDGKIEQEEKRLQKLQIQKGVLHFKGNCLIKLIRGNGFWAITCTYA